MNFAFLIGLAGSLVLVVGAAWPPSSHVNQPVRSVKNWLFALGGLFMLFYAYLGYLQGGPIFFVILEILVVLASVLMMMNISDKIGASIISSSGFFLILWSLWLFEGYGTVIFILGLCGIGLGYVFKMGTLRRDAALTLGSTLIAMYSYLEASWMFFWLNVFFAIFSGYYFVRNLRSIHAAGNTAK